MKGYRTLALNIATSIVGLLVAFDWVGAGMSSATAGYIISGLGVANTVLRFFTSTPVGQSGSNG